MIVSPVPPVCHVIPDRSWTEGSSRLLLENRDDAVLDLHLSLVL